jgi:hypothetical protein
MTINHNQFPSLWHGHIVKLDEDQNIKQTGFGGRYRVRRIGIDNPDADVKDLLFFYYSNPVTAGSGDGEAATSTNLKQGDMVWGFHTDYPRNQKGFIAGVYPRSVLTQYSGDVVTSDTRTASGAAQEGDQTMPSPRNLGPKQLENKTESPKKRVVEGDPGDLPSNTEDIDRKDALRSAVPEATGALGSGNTPGVSQSIVPPASVTQTASQAIANMDTTKFGSFTGSVRVQNAPTEAEKTAAFRAGADFRPYSPTSSLGKQYPGGGVFVPWGQE